MWGVCHKNMSFKIFVVVIPKEEIGRQGPANIFFGMTPTIQYNLWRVHILQIYSQCHTKRMIGRAPPANPSLVWRRQRSLKMHFCSTQLMFCYCKYSKWIMTVFPRKWAQLGRKCVSLPMEKGWAISQEMCIKDTNELAQSERKSDPAQETAILFSYNSYKTATHSLMPCACNT